VSPARLAAILAVVLGAAFVAGFWNLASLEYRPRTIEELILAYPKVTAPSSGQIIASLEPSLPPPLRPPVVASVEPPAPPPPPQSLSPAPARPTDPQSAACQEKYARRGIVVEPAQCVDIDKLIGSLDTGTYTFNKPSVAYVEEPFPIVLVLKTAPGMDVLPAFEAAPGIRVERVAPFAQNIEAVLRGIHFKVEPSGPQQRTATTTAPVEWEWTVTPLESGTRTLVIEVFATIVIGSERSRVQLKVLRENINIRVGAFHWVRSAFNQTSAAVISISAALAALLAIFAAFAPLRNWILRRKAAAANNDS
jgi:hypothetical protein